MCKIYDAIYELAKHVNTNILTCNIGCLEYVGELHKCDCITNDCKCYEGIITLKNVDITCRRTNETKHHEWMNISSKHIDAFSFKMN